MSDTLGCTHSLQAACIETNKDQGRHRDTHTCTNVEELSPDTLIYKSNATVCLNEYSPSPSFRQRENKSEIGKEKDP